MGIILLERACCLSLRKFALFGLLLMFSRRTTKCFAQSKDRDIMCLVQNLAFYQYSFGQSVQVFFCWKLHLLLLLDVIQWALNFFSILVSTLHIVSALIIILQNLPTFQLRSIFNPCWWWLPILCTPLSKPCWLGYCYRFNFKIFV